jgi:hypothetical protein
MSHHHEPASDTRTDANPPLRLVGSASLGEVMLIDDLMPRWDVRSRHQISVQATAAVTYAAIRSVDLGAHPIVRGLLGLRRLPAALARGRFQWSGVRGSEPLTLPVLESRGFHVVAESSPRELVVGVEGAFWTLSGDLRQVSAAAFGTPILPGLARATWCFTVEPVTTDACVLATETRVCASDAPTRRRLLLYWAGVGWGSGLIRRFMLRAIKVEAERQHVRSVRSPP